VRSVGRKISREGGRGRQWKKQDRKIASISLLGGFPAADAHDPNPTLPPTRILKYYFEVNYRPIVDLLPIKM